MSSDDFPAMIVATGFVLCLFLAGSILRWTGNLAESWGVLGGGFAVYSLIQLHSAVYTEEKDSRPQALRFMSFVFTGGAAIVYGIALLTGWTHAGAIATGLSASGIAASIARSVGDHKERRKQRDKE